MLCVSNSNPITMAEVKINFIDAKGLMADVNLVERLLK